MDKELIVETVEIQTVRDNVAFAHVFDTKEIDGGNSTETSKTLERWEPAHLDEDGGTVRIPE